MDMLPKLLVAKPDGTVIEHPTLRAIGRSGDDFLLPAEAPMALPPAARLVQLPGRRPVGLDPASGRVEVVESMRLGARRFLPDAVGATLPPGYTRTLLPPARNDGGEPLPQFAYAAAGWGEEGPVVWAVRTDRRTHWDPRRFSTAELPQRIRRLREELPDNPVLAQLEHCSLEYCCFTAQNVFYERDEGGLPSSVGCNARCVGCISEQRPGGPPSSMDRIQRAPTAAELAAVGARHLQRARGRTMVSFGQGCEGEPLMRGPVLVEAIGRMRAVTKRGSININTNASRPQMLERMFDAGLDAIRVSLNSAHPELYAAYYQPVGYDFAKVERSIAVAREKGAYVALNLLTFPGVTDRLGEVERLAELIVRYRIDQVQARSLCIDPDQYLAVARTRGAGGEPMGVGAMLKALRSEAPWLVVGNFARGLGERGALRPRAGLSAPRRGRSRREPASGGD